MLRRSLAVFILSILLLGIRPAQAGIITATTQTDKYLKIATNQIIVWFPRSYNTVSTGITVTNKIGLTYCKETRPFDFKSGGIYYKITQLNSWTRSGDKVTINCTSDQSGRAVNVTVSFVTAKSFRISYEPATGSTIDQCRVSFSASPNEHFYGLGEPRTGTLDLRGRQIQIWIDKGHPEQTNLIPFLLSSKGYGFLVDSYSNGTIDVVSSNLSATKIIWPGNKLSYYFFWGPEFSQIVDQYTALTGRPPMPPKWQFGLAKWLRPQGANQNAVLQDIQKMEDNGIPMSYTWLEPQWETQLNSLIFRTDLFPNPTAFLANLHSKGYKVGAWLRTDLFEDSPNFAEALNAKHFVMTTAGAQWIASAKDYDYYADTYVYRNRGFVDFTDTDAIPWWENQLQRALNYGFDGFKIDRNYEIDSGCKFQNGESGATAHNKYGYWTSKAHFDFLTRQRGNDFFTMHKSESAGSQAFVTLHWSGDQEGNFTSAGFLSAVVGVQSAGLTGFPFWTSDIGGWYTDNPSKEVYLRWTQFSAFTPAMETLFSPWQFDQQTIDIFRYYTKLHYELMPYIYSLAYLAHQTGEPIVRPMVYHYRTDYKAQIMDRQFMLGQYLLVAPVCTEGAGSTDVYLPKGRWINYWDNSIVYTGPTTVTINTPINGIPVFISAGAIIPLDVKDASCSHGNSSWADALVLDCYPDGDSSFTIYEDGNALEVYSSLGDGYFTMAIPRFSKRVIIRAKTQTTRPSQIRLNGSSLNRYYTQDAFDSAVSGWYWTNDERLLVKYPAFTQALIEAIW